MHRAVGVQLLDGGHNLRGQRSKVKDKKWFSMTLLYVTQSESHICVKCGQYMLYWLIMHQ